MVETSTSCYIGVTFKLFSSHCEDQNYSFIPLSHVLKSFLDKTWWSFVLVRLSWQLGFDVACIHSITVNMKFWMVLILSLPLSSDKKTLVLHLKSFVIHTLVDFAGLVFFFMCQLVFLANNLKSYSFLPSCHSLAIENMW